MQLLNKVVQNYEFENKCKKPPFSWFKKSNNWYDGIMIVHVINLWSPTWFSYTLLKYLDCLCVRLENGVASTSKYVGWERSI